MTRLFRSKSCSLGRLNSSPPRNASLYEGGTDEEEEKEEESQGYDGDGDGDDNIDINNTVTTPFMTPEHRHHQKAFNRRRRNHTQHQHHHHQFPPILAVVTAALRKSLVTCSVERDDVASSMDIGSPTDVRHVSHVTFDRFNGSFLGLPVELQHHVPPRVPSASASVFGVSAQSMQCSNDNRGHNIPTILLKMQHRLYTEGGLLAEGIFRINAENGKEENVRNQLNEGIVPNGIDVHCLAGLIKAWFRELPSGVLDSLTPEQVMHCNTEEECLRLVNLLPSTEAALLDWAIDLMVDVVEHERHNKMNARNIAMVFAPNMTQMADPLTALIHAVQVMNLLKTLIEKTLREREATTSGKSASTCADSEDHKMDSDMRDKLWNETLDRLESDVGYRSLSHRTVLHVMRKRRSLENRLKDEQEGSYDSDEVGDGLVDHKRLSLRKGVSKLYRHPVFQFSKSFKKSGIVDIIKY